MPIYYSKWMLLLLRLTYKQEKSRILVVPTNPILCIGIWLLIAMTRSSLVNIYKECCEYCWSVLLFRCNGVRGDVFLAGNGTATYKLGFGWMMLVVLPVGTEDKRMLTRMTDDSDGHWIKLLRWAMTRSWLVRLTVRPFFHQSMGDRGYAVEVGVEAFEAGP